MKFEQIAFKLWRLARSSPRHFMARLIAKPPHELREEQERLFTSIGLSRADGENFIHNSVRETMDLHMGTSEHYLLFAALAASGYSPSKILEIGTFDGVFARFLGSVFPKTQITTLDLPLEEGFDNEYGRKAANSYVLERATNLKASPNVKLIERNSVALTTETKWRFDAIWVDGDHGYPVATIDITNSIRLLNPGGYLMVDDVYLRVEDPDEKLRSLSAYQTLCALVSAGIIGDFHLIRKRLTPEHNLPWREKYIAIAQKPNTSQ